MKRRVRKKPTYIKAKPLCSTIGVSSFDIVLLVRNKTTYNKFNWGFWMAVLKEYTFYGTHKNVQMAKNWPYIVVEVGGVSLRVSSISLCLCSSRNLLYSFIYGHAVIEMPIAANTNIQNNKVNALPRCA